MFSKTIIVGRVTRDPELKYTQSNIAVCKISVAVNRRFDKDEVDFYNVTIWRKDAENTSKYVRKGNKICIEGRLEFSSYDNKDGVKVNTHELQSESVTFLENNNTNTNEGSNSNAYNRPPAPKREEESHYGVKIEKKKREEYKPPIYEGVSEDDLPF